MPDPRACEVASVTTTVGSLEAARSLGNCLLGARLAACVQLDQAVLSLYRWNGQLCETPEVRLVIKTLPECVPALLDLLAREHSYELPQVLVTTMSASQAYADWVRSEVTVPRPSTAA